MVIILQYWPHDSRGIQNAIEQYLPTLTLSIVDSTDESKKVGSDIYIGSHLVDAVQILKKNKKIIKKENVLIITSTTLGEISGDSITKKIKKHHEQSEIFVFSTKPSDFKKQKRVIASWEKHKHDILGYQYIAKMIEYFMHHHSVQEFIKQNPPQKLSE